MTCNIVEKSGDGNTGLGAYGFASMFRSGAYVPADAEMIADKFKFLGDEIERLREMASRIARVEKVNAILREAVEFYANDNYWMGLTEDFKAKTVLIAHGNNESFWSGKDGSAMADWALRQAAKI